MKLAEVRAQDPGQRRARRCRLEFGGVSIGGVKADTRHPGGTAYARASLPVFSYSEVSARVSILADSTSGWLKGLIPITEPATAVAISQVKNCPKIS